MTTQELRDLEDKLRTANNLSRKKKDLNQEKIKLQQVLLALNDGTELRSDYFRLSISSYLLSNCGNLEVFVDEDIVNIIIEKHISNIDKQIESIDKEFIDL